MITLTNFLESAAKLPAGVWWVFGVGLGISVLLILYLWRDGRRGGA